MYVYKLSEDAIMLEILGSLSQDVETNSKSFD